MCFACWITWARIETYTQNTEYLLLFHDKNGYENKCYFVLIFLYLPRKPSDINSNSFLLFLKPVIFYEPGVYVYSAVCL